ncbi:MAG: VOC family protein [Actinomycetota bacterium]
MPEITGIGHITLTVNDLEKSTEFYNKVFNAQTIDSGDDEHGRWALSLGPPLMVGLREHAKTSKGDGFDPFRVGLDHFGVHVGSKEELESWKTWLDECGAKNSGIVESPYGLHLNAKDPDAIAIEFFVPAQ